MKLIIAFGTVVSTKGVKAFHHTMTTNKFDEKFKRKIAYEVESLFRKRGQVLADIAFWDLSENEKVLDFIKSKLKRCN